MKANYIFVGTVILIIPTIASAELSSGPSVSVQENEFKPYKPYVTFSLGVANTLKVVDSDKFNIKKAPNFIGAVGITDKTIEGEFGLSYTHNHATHNVDKNRAPAPDLEYVMTKSFVTSYAVMGNGNYIFNLHYIINPYIGFGGGIVNVKLKQYDIYKFTSKKSEMETFVYQNKYMPAYQMIFGVKYLGMKDTIVLINYRYFSTFNKLKFEELKAIKHKFQYHAFNIGVQFLF